MGYTGYDHRRSCAAADQPKMKPLRDECGIAPAFKMVDTCAAEFDGRHALLLLDLLSSENEVEPPNR